MFDRQPTRHAGCEDSKKKQKHEQTKIDNEHKDNRLYEYKPTVSIRDTVSLSEGLFSADQEYSITDRGTSVEANAIHTGMGVPRRNR